VLDARAVRRRFEELAGRPGRVFGAPGRVNLIGEHTDYNDGFVLPVAIDRGVLVAGAAREDRTVQVHALDLEATAAIDLDRPGPPRRGSWVDHVEGVVRALIERGVALGGADLAIASDVPPGAGLSSSAAIEVAVGLALSQLAGAELTPTELALAGQAAEHEYVGTRCGIMDQLASALGERDRALLIDCRSLVATSQPMELGDVVLVVVDSGVKHELASSAYNQRRAECEEAVRRLAAVLPGIIALRDVSPEELERHAGVLPDPIGRRCRHVVGENRRVLAAVERLRAGDIAGLGQLLVESHRSTRDDYQVSCAELDFLADETAGAPGWFGGRMTGGGFGGCTIHLVAGAELEAFTAHTGERFAARFGRRPASWAVRAAPGARELEVG
jgi:galactokinase